MIFNTRIAPSPTGDMHLGTARTAYFNWLAAKATSGNFILRIDDTDTKRNNSSKVDDILKIMDWLSLDYSKIIYQSDRLDFYKNIASYFVHNNYAKMNSDNSVILNLDDDFLKDIKFEDIIAGIQFITQKDIDYIKNMPIIKSDGYPTYNFCSILDDLDPQNGINFIIRGNDHFQNTFKQMVIMKILKEIKIPFDQNVKFAHLGLIFHRGKKLSKRTLDGSLSDGSMIKYLEEGIDPDAMLNFLLRLGWGPKKDDKSTAIINRSDALKLFLNDGNLKNTSSNFDIDKLKSFDRKYKARKRSV